VYVPCFAVEIKSIHTFYSYEGALVLSDTLRDWKGGRMVVNVVENPIKCPVAPLEFLMLADWYFHERGMRGRVELVYTTHLPGAFTKPVASNHRFARSPPGRPAYITDEWSGELRLLLRYPLKCKARSGERGFDLSIAVGGG
jgi:hypothetical protein